MSPILLLHGWPHTSRVWDLVRPLLGARLVIAPDLHGDVSAARIGELLDGVPRAVVVGFDASLPAAFAFAARNPERVERLVLMEALLPGGFPVPPWWFGFHAVPGLPETVLAGNEAAYVGHFLGAGTVRPIPAELRAALVAGHTGPGDLARSLGFYRRTEEIRPDDRLTVPTVVLGGDTVGDRLRQQLEPLAGDLTAELLDGCGHIVPLDRPDAVAAAITG